MNNSRLSVGELLVPKVRSKAGWIDSNSGEWSGAKGGYPPLFIIFHQCGWNSVRPLASQHYATRREVTLVEFAAPIAEYVRRC